LLELQAGSISTYRNQSSDATVFLSVAALVLLADQLSKHYILSHFLPGESRIVVPRLLKWTFEQNQHGAFGLFGSSPILLIGMALVVLAIFLVIVVISRYVSLGSIVASAAFPILAFYLYRGRSSVVDLLVMLGASLLIIFKHKSNIQRLINGTESRLHFGKS